MIDRLAELSDIVAPRAVARPPAAGWWQGPSGWLLGAVLFALALAAALSWARRLRRRSARRRLQRLASALRGSGGNDDVAVLLPRVWADLRRAGIAPESLAGDARRKRQRLLYARHAARDALLALLEDVQP